MLCFMMGKIVLNDVLTIAVVYNALSDRALEHHVALDNYGGRVDHINIVIGTPRTASVIVYTPFEGVSGKRYVLRIVKIYMGIFIFRGKFHTAGTTGTAENISCDCNIAELSASAKFDCGPEGTVEEITGDIDRVTVPEPKAGFAVPFHPVSGCGDGCGEGAAENTGVSVGGKPVINNKCVPSVNIQAGAAVSMEHGMADREAPDMFKMYAVTGKITDAAIVNCRGILLGTTVVPFPIQIDTVNVCSEFLSVETHSGDRTAERAGDIQKTYCFRIVQKEDRAAVCAEILCGISFKAGTDSHFQTSGQISSCRDNNFSFHLCRIVQRLLDCSGTIGLSVADGTIGGDIKYVCHNNLPINVL